MIELSEHLLDLVFRQKSAIIPELGTFKFVSTSAKMDFGENLLYPPTQNLVFTESTFDQGDLSFLDFLVKEKGFDPHEASIRIKAFVYQIRNNFKQLNYSYIPGFGTIHQLDNEALRFTAGDRIKAMKPTMGLPELSIIPIAREFVKDQPLETGVETTTFIDNRSEKVTSEKNRWVVPSLICFLLLGFGLIAYYLYVTQFQEQNAEMAKRPVTLINEDSMKFVTHGFKDTTAVVDSVSDKEAMLVEIDHTPAKTIADPVKVSKEQITKVAVVEETSDNADKTNASETSVTKQCAVIVGAMGNPANAKKLARTVKSHGYTPYSYKSKGLTKVGAACNCDSESIESTLEDMKKINSSAWVYESE